ncbi:MAG: hypothetical protein ACI909_002879 [Planctomycetota bacterium]|jgi:uncharacterized protein YbjT (DUF2867 family)
MQRLISLFCLMSCLIACDNSNEAQVSKEVAPIVQEQGKLILVTGVTGKQGGAVARALLDKGYQVRGLTRNPESERAQAMKAPGLNLIKGDFEDIASLESAMKDVYGVFLVTNFWEHGYEAEVQQGKNFVDAAKRSKVEHLVFSSVVHADLKTGIAHFESKFEIEKYIHSKDLPFTILRPVSFMENWEYSRENIIAGKINSPFSLATRMQQISVRDIGRFAELSFSEPNNWIGRTIEIASEEYTMKQVVNLFSRVTASPVELVQIPWDVYEKDQGTEMTVMDRWIDDVGYKANINMARAELKDMLTLEEYLIQAGW